MAVLTVGALGLALPIGTASGTAIVPDLDFGVAQGPDTADRRIGSVAPSTAALTRVRDLGARVTWNQYGTPASLIKHGGFLATGLGGDAVAAARSFVSTNRVLFRLSDAGLRGLEMVNDQRMPGSAGHAVLFRQRFGTLPAAQDGMITVGVVNGSVAYVSSSAVGDGNVPAAPTVTATQAWVTAARNVAVPKPLSAITGQRQEDGWTVFTVAGVGDLQRSRLVALPTPRNGVRPAFETIVLDSKPGHEVAYTVFVDAVTGDVLFRTNRLDHLAPSGGEFQGTYTATSCGPEHEFGVPAGTKSVTVAATAAVPANDIVLKLIGPTGVVVGSSDTATSPEAVQYAPAEGVAPGTYAAQVCPFDATEVLPPASYVGSYVVSDVTPSAFPAPPKWDYFLANPPLDGANTDTRVTGCFTRADANLRPPSTLPPGCDREEGNTAARQPWDVDPRLTTPSFTTRGNSARSAEAWASPLSPAEQYSPVSPTREYQFPWTDQWRDSKCSPTVFTTPQRNDIDASTTNLFAEHNRMHDWSYFLGFTENNYNMQFSNFGNTPPAQENDPEVGNSQAGAVSGGFPSFMGRDNANQITLNDGVPGITNMYLWQPLPSAFYADCVDGDFDQSVIGHEYTHAISNRMVGGPDAGLTSGSDGQARAMGESYSDLTAAEYLNEFKYVPTNGENPFSVGAYVTGNKATGIRNYAMNNSPLNFSNVQGYDGSGMGSPHDDGEIWSAANFDIRQAMIAKYNATFPAGDAALQRRCGEGRLPADQCPGNRRWMQIVFDAYLLMPPAVSMLGSRDAYLAADLMRFGGANQSVLWNAFAKRGFGQFASTQGTDDPQPVPSFESPTATNEATVTFAPVNEQGQPVPNAKIFVGRYEGRVTPVADTITEGATAGAATATARFVPGTYDFVVQAPGYGMTRFSRTLTAGTTKTARLFLATNWASLHQGATATGDGANFRNLIDDTEASNYLSGPTNPSGPAPSPKVGGRQVTVDLGGGSHLVDTVKVSALLRSGSACQAPEECDPQDLSQNRFSALRQFAVEVCTATSTQTCQSRSTATTAGSGYQRIYTSPANAFPGAKPRPLAPQLNLRTFDVPDRQATHVRMVVLANQCTGNPQYQGDQDNDPAVNSDCRTDGTPDEQVLVPQDTTVRAAEFQVFSRGGEGGGGSGTPQDPFVAFTMTAPATTDQGATLTYDMRYANLGPAPSSGAKIVDKLPVGVTFVSATGPATYDAATRTVTWDLGDVPVLKKGGVTLTVRVGSGVTTGTVLTNTAEFSGALTTATPGVAASIVL